MCPNAKATFLGYTSKLCETVVASFYLALIRAGQAPMTLPRYIASVATIYFVVFLAIVVGLGGWDAISIESFIGLFAGTIVMAVLGTLSAISRFGDAGGSIYAIPTTIHVFVLIVVVVVAWLELRPH